MPASGVLYILQSLSLADVDRHALLLQFGALRRKCRASCFGRTFARRRTFPESGEVARIEVLCGCCRFLFSSLLRSLTKGESGEGEAQHYGNRQTRRRTSHCGPPFTDRLDRRTTRALSRS